MFSTTIIVWLTFTPFFFKSYTIIYIRSYLSMPINCFYYLSNLFKTKSHQKIKQKSKQKINYLPFSKIIDLDITQLDNIGTYVEYVDFVKSNKISKITSENDFNQIAVLYYMHTSIDYFVSKHDFNIKDALLRLLKFKIVMINYLNELNNTLNNHNSDDVDIGLDVINVKSLYVCIGNKFNSSELEIIKKSYTHYVNKILGKPQTRVD